jgi:hypothetical protein
MLCKDGRALRLTCVVTLAPGFLSDIPKLSDLLPKYVVVNTLMPVRVWQDSSIFRPPSADQTASTDLVAKDRSGDFVMSVLERRRVKSIIMKLWGRETILDEARAWKV